MTILIPFPCCCVIDALSVSTDRDRTIVECSWCGAVFLAAELREWLKNGAPLICLQRAEILARVGECVVKVVGVCNCGSPLGNGWAGTFHLGDEAVPARN